MIRALDLKTQPIPAADKHEFCRIISAAVVNARFRKELLADPVKAVSIGYSDEKFALGRDQTARLAAIHASSLAEFAAQLA
jgi:hypothetical protein